MPTASERAALEAERWRGIASRWSPDEVPDLYRDRPPAEHAVVVFYDPVEDLERRTSEWEFAMARPHLDELARFASSLAEAEGRAWADDVPDLAVRAYEGRRLLLSDRIAHWAVPWLDAVGRRYPGRGGAVRDRDTILEIADEMRIAPALSGTEGLVVPGEDAFGPIVIDTPLDRLLQSLWSGEVMLEAADSPEAGHYRAVAERWRSVAHAHAGSARLWLDLAARADRTAEAVGAAAGD
jgi:hypothetical protein